MSENIIEIFLANAARHGDRTALVAGDRRTTYAQLAADVMRAARYLDERGVRRGDNVLLFVPMSRELYTILLALFHVGATAVFVDAWADRKRLAAACEAIPIRAFIATARAQLLRFVSSHIRAIPIKLGANLSRWRPRAGDRPAAPAEVDRSAAALVTFTTGSTGAPRGAVRSHGFLVAQHAAIVSALGQHESDRDMPVLPIFVLANLATGCTTVLPPVDPRHVGSFDPERVAEVVKRERVDTSSGSPAFYERLAVHAIDNPAAYAAMRSIHLGGAPVFPSLARSLAASFPSAAITIVYGSTEAEPVSSITAAELLDRAASGRARHGLPVGRPVSGIEVRILPIDEQTMVSDPAAFDALALPPGEAGEICVAGEHVLRDYAGGGMENKIVVGDVLWHRMGDAGYIDADGVLHLLGRVAQSFMHAGERVFAFPLEQALLALDGVAIGTVVNQGGRAVAAVQLRPGADGASIERSIRAAAIPHDHVAVLPAIPRDPRHNSKIDYRRLREILNDMS